MHLAADPCCAEVRTSGGSHRGAVPLESVLPAGDASVIMRERPADKADTVDTAPAARPVTELTARAAAEALGVSERTVRRAIARGEMPATKYAGTYRIAPEVLAFFRRRLTAPTLLRRPFQTTGEAGLPRMLPPAIAPVPSLPAPLTPFVGREAEMAAVGSLLRRPEVRLVTLTGPGGIGKTRLALRVAADLDGEFADGLAFVSLAPIANPALVMRTVAGALAVREGDQPLIARLHNALRQRKLLLILDNFEQVLAAASDVAALLGACPGLTILATSRVALNVSGEQRFPVPPLAVPTLVPGPSLTDLAEAEAVRLFCARARAVLPDFTLTADNAATVAAVCVRLDGLPLAIELAAARSAVLSPQTMLARLSPRLDLLTGGPSDQPPRLRSMRDAIAWSHDLLVPEVQVLFRRLAVFAGGFSLEAAEVVGGEEVRRTGGKENDSPPYPLTPSPAILDGIASLVDASLLRRETELDGTARYWMLETVREFAEERLTESDEATSVRRAHAAHFLALAERYELAELQPDGDRVFALLEAEHANLRAALTWLEGAGEVGSFLRLAAALGRFWSVLGHYQEGRSWLKRALAHDGAAETPDRAKALVALGIIEAYLGMHREAETSLTEGLAGCRDQGDTFNAAWALIGLGALTTLRHDLRRATALLEESLAASQTVADRRLAGIMSGRALLNLAVVARALGDHALADERLREALRRMRDAAYTAGTIMSLGDLGDLARDRGDHGRALELYREALGLVRGNAGTREVTDVIEAVGVVAVAVGQAERGARLVGAAEALRERTGLRYRVAENQVALEHALTVASAALDKEAFGAAWAAGRSLLPPQAVAEALAPFAMPAAAPGASLTPREAEILPLLAAGRTNREIGAALFLSHRTIGNHVTRLTAKLGVRTRAAAVETARAKGLLPPLQ